MFENLFNEEIIATKPETVEKAMTELATCIMTMAPFCQAYVQGYWDEFTSFVRSLFNASFKTNPYLERAIMTGITRVKGQPQGNEYLYE